ncbi:trypsin-like [Ostrinia furnacalis]|uniref:trypsin-like n=1 Tax=Ostrinia furnacalis TaxID=93504 RepID=UPI001039E522|nr:trypsin-like [Ostrinia furnacalis]
MVVTESNVFPYVVSVLKKSSYLSAGALLDDKWVLTAADALFLVRESARVIKVRLGSINYKKGGVLLPVKSIEVHPLFDDSKPAFDVALIMLAERVWLTPTLSPIRIQTNLQEITATHFIVTAWTPLLRIRAKPHHVISMDTIKQRRMLSVSHLHPSDPELCKKELNDMGINDTGSIMCLDPDLNADPCWRDTGAPVVLNGVLWGVVSSWRPDDCYSRPGRSYAVRVAARDVRSWLHAATRGHRWNRTEYDEEDDSSER